MLLSTYLSPHCNLSLCLFFCDDVYSDEVSIAKAREGDLGFNDASLCRAFTVLRPDQLGHVIRDGWAAISDSLIFSTHPGVVGSLYSADGGSRFALGDIDTHSNLSGSDFSGPVMEEAEMACLQEAKKMQPLLLVRYTRLHLHVKTPFYMSYYIHIYPMHFAILTTLRTPHPSHHHLFLLVGNTCFFLYCYYFSIKLLCNMNHGICSL
jgi:hypothetical protein